MAIQNVILLKLVVAPSSELLKQVHVHSVGKLVVRSDIVASHGLTPPMQSASAPTAEVQNGGQVEALYDRLKESFEELPLPSEFDAEVSLARVGVSGNVDVRGGHSGRSVVTSTAEASEVPAAFPLRAPSAQTSLTGGESARPTF